MGVSSYYEYRRIPFTGFKFRIQQLHKQCRYETFRINYSLPCAGFHLGNRRLVLLRRLRLSANHPTQSGQGLQHHCCHFAKLPEQVPKEPELQVDHQCNKGEAEIDLQQIQDGVVLKLQERLSFCWQCCKIQQVVPLRIETSYKSLPQVQGQDNGAEVYIQ